MSWPSVAGVQRGPAKPPQPGAPAWPTFADQSGLPSARFNATTKHSSPLSPIENTLSPEVAMLEYPPPSPVAFQSSFGPPAGHCLSRPVSAERPSRFGPRHWGQSLTAWATAPSAMRPRDIVED